VGSVSRCSCRTVIEGDTSASPAAGRPSPPPPAAAARRLWAGSRRGGADPGRRAGPRRGAVDAAAAGVGPRAVRRRGASRGRVGLRQVPGFPPSPPPLGQLGILAAAVVLAAMLTATAPAIRAARVAPVQALAS